MNIRVDNRNELFSQRELELTESCKKLAHTSLCLSSMRFLFFILSALFFIIYFFAMSKTVFLLGGLICFFVFVVFIFYHSGVKKKHRYFLQLLSVHEEYKARAVHAFSSLPDEGSDFINPDHDFSSDLDLFGSGSLFHLLNVAVTYFGRKNFRNILLYSSASHSSDTIQRRQEAVSELLSEPWKLQEFQAEAKAFCRKKSSPKAFFDAISTSNGLGVCIKTPYLILFLCSSILMLSSILISVFSSLNLFPVFAILVIFQLSVTAINFNRNKLIFQSAQGIHRELSGYQFLFERIENAQHNSSLLREMRTRVLDLEHRHGGAASKQIRRLSFISQMIEARNQPLLFFILNTFCLYDSYCLYFLQKWAAESGSSMADNLQVLGDWEALSSLAMMGIVYPESVFPIIRSEDNQLKSNAYFSAKEIGHPLIPAIRQVCNDFDLPSGIALVTGSNMSGKTTLLRTIGINAVLAYAGAPCCAKKLELAIMDIASSMRIADRLDSGLSTFYAELLRIERIIRKSKNETPLLFLIDEIFRGTNSMDRTDGAIKVIENLQKPWVIGLLSTHDYQLCEENRNTKGIRFYHFSEKYDEEGIHFDYQLGVGISTSRNAQFLMKMVGID